MMILLNGYYALIVFLLFSSQNLGLVLTSDKLIVKSTATRADVHAVFPLRHACLFLPSYKVFSQITYPIYYPITPLCLLQLNLHNKILRDYITMKKYLYL